MNITLNSGGYPVVPAQESWHYPDFNLVFEDKTLNRRFKFKRHLNPDHDSKLVFEQLIKKVPESYELDSEGSTFEIRLPKKSSLVSTIPGPAPNHLSTNQHGEFNGQC